MTNARNIRLAQAGTVAVLDAATFQIDDVFQQEFLGDVGEVEAGQILVVLLLGESRERSAELFVHAGGADARYEFAVLEFFVVVEVVDAGVDVLKDGQYFRLCFRFLFFFEIFAGGGFKTLGFIVPAFVSSGDVDDPGNAGVTGLVENHFQFDHLGVLGVFATFECDRTIHIVNFLVAHVFL